MYLSSPIARLCEQQHILWVESRLRLFRSQKMFVGLFERCRGRRGKESRRNFLLEPCQFCDLVTPTRPKVQP